MSCEKEWTPPVCGKCGGKHQHFHEALTCIYQGAPLKDGGAWTDETSKAVSERIAKRLDDALAEDS